MAAGHTLYIGALRTRDLVVVRRTQLLALLQTRNILAGMDDQAALTEARVRIDSMAVDPWADDAPTD
jgi:hypothetical protein